MPRRARIALAGVPMHIRHRGNNGQECFFADADRAFYVFHLKRLLLPSQCRLHAYCLMPNHVHLLVTPLVEHACARLMQRVAQLHSQYINRTYERSGSLWEGRFRSCLVQAEDYVIACYRYIESNPVRAGLCADPADYAWSSYRFNGRGASDGALVPHERYEALGRTPDERREAYRALFASDPRYWRVDEIRKASKGNFALGSEAFKRRLAAQLGRRVAEGRPGRPALPQPDERQLDLLDDKNVVCP
jgi:putative transposase